MVTNKKTKTSEEPCANPKGDPKCKQIAVIW